MKLGILMDPIDRISVHKDTSFAMLLEAQRRNYEVYYFEPNDVWSLGQNAYANTKTLSVKDQPDSWFKFTDEQTINLTDLDVVLIRTEPPVDEHYIFVTQLLELAEAKGLMVINKPSSIRDFNEKLAINWFEQLIPPTLVSSNKSQLIDFLQTHKKIIIKPLSGMGGSGIFLLQLGDKNINVILETSTNNGNKLVMAQGFVEQVHLGDKRIIIIDGKPIDYALARIPAQGEIRGNLAKGATAKGQKLSANDYKICQQLAPTLQAKGLLFVGIDVIGDYLTEINITSPTGVRELDRQYNLNIIGDLFDAIEAKL